MEESVFENLPLSAYQYTFAFMKTGVQLSCSEEPEVTQYISSKITRLQDDTNVCRLLHIAERQ
jgi:hypothetical protein